MSTCFTITLKSYIISHPELNTYEDNIKVETMSVNFRNTHMYTRTPASDYVQQQL